MRIFELPEPRNSHVNVVELHPRIPRISRRHPSLQPAFFDQDVDNAADRCVLLTPIEAKAIASLLQSARSHLPSPRACDDAIAILMGKRP
jgi:hypothetical protein